MQIAAEYEKDEIAKQLKHLQSTQQSNKSGGMNSDEMLGGTKKKKNKKADA